MGTSPGPSPTCPPHSLLGCTGPYLPTTMSSHSEERGRKWRHRSMVKMVLELLKMDVREDMRAAIITDIIRPRSPTDQGRGTCLIAAHGKQPEPSSPLGGQAPLTANCCKLLSSTLCAEGSSLQCPGQPPAPQPKKAYPSLPLWLP